MNALRKARTDAGLTLQQLSEKSGVAMETLSRLENDQRKPQLRTLAKIADVLGIPVSELAESRQVVFVGDFDPRDEEIHGERLSFRGEKIKTLERYDKVLTLYKGPNGYRVHVIESGTAGSLYPHRKNPDTGEPEYSTYAVAEDLVKDFPEFKNTVGIYPLRYID